MQAVGLKLITKLGANLKTETKNITISRTRLDGIDAAPLDHLILMDANHPYSKNVCKPLLCFRYSIAKWSNDSNLNLDPKNCKYGFAMKSQTSRPRFSCFPAFLI
jgi:hypothetical protein